MTRSKQNESAAKRLQPEDVAKLDEVQVAIEEKLRSWRKDEAGRAGLPSFFVLSDTVLRSIVLARPRSPDELGMVQGLGAEKVEKFGAAIVELCGG